MNADLPLWRSYIDGSFVAPDRAATVLPVHQPATGAVYAALAGGRGPYGPNWSYAFTSQTKTLFQSLALSVCSILR